MALTKASDTVVQDNLTINAGTINASTLTNPVITGSIDVSGPTTISVNSSSNALRVTQTGSGYALVVEDSTTPDASPFIIDSEGRMSLGASAPSANVSFINSRTITGGTTGYGIVANGQVQPDVTTAFNIQSSPSVAGGTAVGGLRHFYATQGTLTGTVTNQYGFQAGSNLTGATTNYGFYSDIANGTGRWNFYASGDAPNYFAGSVNLGAATPGTTAKLKIGGNAPAYTSYTPIYIYMPTNASNIDNIGVSLDTFVGSSAALTTLTGFRVNDTGGWVGTAANMYGFKVESTWAGATNTYGFHSGVTNGTNKWNFYATGDAPNYFAGELRVTSPTQVTALGITSKIQANSQYPLQLGNFANDSAGTNLLFVKSRSTTVGTPVTTLNGDYYGLIRWTGVNSSNAWKETGRITVIQNGAAGTDVPADMVFSLNTGSGLTESLRITKNQHFEIRNNLRINDGYGNYLYLGGGGQAVHSNPWATTDGVGTNACMGYQAGQNLSCDGYSGLGTYDTAIGSYALKSTTSGIYNTAVGFQALSANTIGANNTAVGSNALLNLVGNYASNTAVGYGSLRYMQDGSNASSITNSTGLGYNARVSGSNQVQIGDSATTTYVYGTVQNRSDLRDKADIRDTVLGLNFINALRPVDFKWDYREDYFDTVSHDVVVETIIDEEVDGEIVQKTIKRKETTEELVVKPKDGKKKRGRYHHGLIAQEVQALIQRTGVDFGGFQDHAVNGGNEVMSIGYDELIAPLIKAVQELSAKVAALEGKVK